MSIYSSSKTNKCHVILVESLNGFYESNKVVKDPLGEFQVHLLFDFVIPTATGTGDHHTLSRFRRAVTPEGRNVFQMLYLRNAWR